MRGIQAIFKFIDTIMLPDSLTQWRGWLIANERFIAPLRRIKPNSFTWTWITDAPQVATFSPKSLWNQFQPFSRLFLKRRMPHSIGLAGVQDFHGFFKL